MILSCQDLCCQRTNWNECDQVSIRDVTLSFYSGTFYEFSGPDHSGRDLLMNNLALLEPWDSGTIWLDGRNLHQILESDLRRLRNETFGFVFEHPCLLPSFSVAENVPCPCSASVAQTLMPLGSELMTCSTFAASRTSKSARRPPGLICSAAGCLGACLGSSSANPRRHLPVCPQRSSRFSVASCRRARPLRALGGAGWIRQRKGAEEIIQVRGGYVLCERNVSVPVCNSPLRRRKEIQPGVCPRMSATCPAAGRVGVLRLLSRS